MNGPLNFIQRQYIDANIVVVFLFFIFLLTLLNDQLEDGNTPNSFPKMAAEATRADNTGAISSPHILFQVCTCHTLWSLSLGPKSP